MAYSTIPLVIDQLLITLPARAGLAGVLIEDGVPIEIPATREGIYVDDPVNITREWAALGQLRIDESYDLQIKVEVLKEGDDRAAARARLFALIAEVEQAAVLDITMAGILSWGIKPGPFTATCIPAGDAGWHAQATLNLHCSGRIQAS